MEQLDMFEVLYDKLPIRRNIKLGTFFSGIGSPEMALTELSEEFDFNYESMFYSEIDKYAIKAYCAIHNQVEDECLGSITDIKGIDLPYCDVWVGGFPCQDISLAGKGKGFDPDSETRSSLGFEMIRLLKEVTKKPMYVVFENVANITSKNKSCTHCKDSIYYPHERTCKCGKTYLKTNLAVLQQLKDELKMLGYTLNDDKLNAKDHGIPQNRNRYFLVAVLGEYSFKFPSPIKLELRLKDMLEDEVDDRYYLSDKMMKYIYSADDDNKKNGSGTYQVSKNSLQIDRDIAVSVTTREGNTRADSSNYITIPENAKVVGNVNPSGKGMNGNVYQGDISPTLTTNKGEGIKILEATKQGYAIARDGDGVDVSYLDSETRRGRVQEEMSGTIQCNDSLGVVESDLRIRKLTPKECYRLMGFKDEAFERAAKVISNSQLYKTAGNSIVVKVLEAIFTNLFMVKGSY
jgi:DNA (cytosine-5)-methyltransferase 1